jgi:NTE family protein
MMEAPPQPAPDPGIALALGSAFLGVYAHGGFLCGLNRAGIFPGHIAGASAGALAGGFYAAGLRGSDLEEAVLSPALKKSYPDLWMPIRGAPLGIGILSGMMGGKRVVRHLRSVLPVAAIEETPDVKLSIAVTDLRRSESAFLTGGPLAESIMASCAVPILFSGQEVGGRKYHDGGIIHDIPLEPFVSDPEIHTVIIHRISYPDRDASKHLSIRQAFINGHHMLRDALHEHRVRRAEANGKRVILLETTHPHPGLFQSKATKKRYFEDGHRTGSTISQQPSA